MASPKADDFFVYRIQRAEGLYHVVSLLPEDIVFKWGMADEAIMGILTKLPETGAPLDPADFHPHRPFVALLHDVIAATASQALELQIAASEHATGFVYVIDARTRTPAGEVPAQDIMGSFEVNEGKLKPNSYLPNPNHLLFSADGIFKLRDVTAQQELMDRLIRLTTDRSRPPTRP